MSKTATKTFAARLAAILDLDKKFPVDAEANPFAKHTVEQIAQTSGHPQLNMTPKGGMAYEMEAARTEAISQGKATTSAHRMAAARRRAERKLEFDALAKSEVQPSQERMDMAWYVVFPLVPIIRKIASGKQQWASRLLGANVDDIGQMALEQMALVLAKSDKDLTVLREAAEQLGEVVKRTNQVPGDQAGAKAAKEVRKARKWLMGMANNRVQGALVDSYMSPENVRWDNIDRITTVMASINGIDGDPLTARFKADRAPAFLGTKFQRPGGIDSGVMAAAINAAIGERGLDRMVEVLIDADNRRIDGSMAWSKNAEAIFLATPGVSGEQLWHMVVKSTKHLAKPSRARADAARLHARNQFAWLPGFIVSLVDAFDWRPVAFGSDHRKIMASDFEFYLDRHVDDMGEYRFPLVPVLEYASVEEAAAALTDSLSNLRSGADLIKELMDA